MSVIARATIEDNIVTQIKATVTGLQCEAFPDSPESYKAGRDRIVLVSYVGKARNANQNGRGTLTNNTQSIVLTYVYKNRRTHQGVLADMDAIEAGLSGFKIGTTFLSLSDERFDGYDQDRGRWVYTQTYERVEHFNNR